MANAVLQNLPTYSIENVASEHQGKWATWRWVRMADLVKEANRLFPGMNWTANGVFRDFEHLNKFPEFWFYIDGTDRAHNIYGSRVENLDDTNFMVPQVWAFRVHELLKRGFVKVSKVNNIFYAHDTRNDSEVIHL